MPTAAIDGIVTHYEVTGDGPPLLMFSPGGFNAIVANWTSFSIYARLRLLDHLAKSYTCVTYDRRESGSSAGRKVIGTRKIARTVTGRSQIRMDALAGADVGTAQRQTL